VPDQALLSNPIPGAGDQEAVVTIDTIGEYGMCLRAHGGSDSVRQDGLVLSVVEPIPTGLFSAMGFGLDRDLSDEWGWLVALLVLLLLCCLYCFCCCRKSKRRVLQVSITGEPLKRYRSPNVAAAQNGLNRNKLKKLCDQNYYRDDGEELNMYSGKCFIWEDDCAGDWKTPPSSSPSYDPMYEQADVADSGEAEKPETVEFDLNMRPMDNLGENDAFLSVFDDDEPTQHNEENTPKGRASNVRSNLEELRALKAKQAATNGQGN